MRRRALCSCPSRSSNVGAGVLFIVYFRIDVVYLILLHHVEEASAAAAAVFLIKRWSQQKSCWCFHSALQWEQKIIVIMCLLEDLVHLMRCVLEYFGVPQDMVSGRVLLNKNTFEQMYSAGGGESHCWETASSPPSLCGTSYPLLRPNTHCNASCVQPTGS